MKICKKSVLLGFILGVVIVTVIALTFCNFSKKQKFAYVNIEQVINHVSDRVKNNESENLATAELARYRKLFDKVLEDHASRNEVIIFSSPKPIAGADDITEVLIKQVFKNEPILQESGNDKKVSPNVEERP
jgi:hypothetical protein